MEPYHVAKRRRAHAKLSFNYDYRPLGHEALTQDKLRAPAYEPIQRAERDWVRIEGISR